MSENVNNKCDSNITIRVLLKFSPFCLRAKASVPNIYIYTHFWANKIMPHIKWALQKVAHMFVPCIHALLYTSVNVWRLHLIYVADFFIFILCEKHREGHFIFQPLTGGPILKKFVNYGMAQFILDRNITTQNLVPVKDHKKRTGPSLMICRLDWAQTWAQKQAFLGAKPGPLVFHKSPTIFRLPPPYVYNRSRVLEPLPKSRSRRRGRESEERASRERNNEDHSFFRDHGHPGWRQHQG